MTQTTTAALSITVALLGLGLGIAGADTTTRVRGAIGTGFVDETTAPDGTVVRRQAHDESGRPTEDTRYDRESGEPTGSTEHTYDEEGNLQTTTENNAEGEPTSTSTYDDDGNLARHETFGEFGETTERREFNYDEDGNVTDINVFGEDGTMTTSFHYGWKDGKLTSAEENDLTTEPDTLVGIIFYNEDGTVQELRGDASGALAIVDMSVDPSSHTTPGPHGSRITVRHNPDGTYDVTVVHPDGRVTRGHLRHGAGCYLGDECPYEHGEEFQQAAPGAASGAVPPISQLPPARPGGMPAHVPVPTPSIGTGQPHGSPTIPVGRPPSSGGRY